MCKMATDCKCYASVSDQRLVAWCGSSFSHMGFTQWNFGITRDKEKRDIRSPVNKMAEYFADILTDMCLLDVFQSK